MQTYKIALAQFPGGGVSRMETNAYIVRLVRQMDKDDRISEVVSLTFNDTPITHLRNRAVLEARAAACQYLLMIDSDMAPDQPYVGARPFWATAWEFMMERRTQESAWRKGYLCKHGNWYVDDADSCKVFPFATIAAPYCGPPPDECCFVFQWASRSSDNPNPDFQLEMIPRESAAIRAGIQEVAALPTGLILYDMRVFDVLPPPWFEYEWGDPPYNTVKATTEDVYQTRNASLLGLPQFCAWDCWAGHMKSKRVGKPLIVTRDQVHRSLADAVRRGVDSSDRFIILAPREVHDPAPAEHE